jgi:hypothetical protein
MTIGAGSFSPHFYGNIYSPDDIIAACPGPIFMTKGVAELASEKEFRRFYATRGGYNPNPEKLKSRSMTHQGVNLFDLVQIGTDGACAYHQLHIKERSPKFGYCMITEGGEYESKLPSFTKGLRNILLVHKKAIAFQQYLM